MATRPFGTTCWGGEHTATVYGLVASMQSGRFTVTDLMEFLMESAEEDNEA